MANTCFTLIHFKGEVKKLHRIIERSENATGYGYKSFYNVLVSAGVITGDEEAGKKLPCSSHGLIVYYNLKADDHLVIQTETAWSSRTSIWFYLRDFLDGDFTIDYLSDEAGSDYYMKHDESGELSDIDYYFEICPSYDEDRELFKGLEFWQDEGSDISSNQLELILKTFYINNEITRPVNETLEDSVAFFRNYVSDIFSDDGYFCLVKYEEE